MSADEPKINEDEEKNDDKNDKDDAEQELKRKLVEFMHIEVDEMECYHGIMLEDDMRAAVQRDGDFLLRTRPNPDGSKEMLLTVKKKGEILDIKLRAVTEGKNRDGSPRMMLCFDRKTRQPGIKALIDKHRLNTPIQWKKIEVLLLNPIAKGSWELKRDWLTLEKKLGEGAFGEVRAGTLKYRFPGADGARLINVAVKVIKRSANNEKATTELQKEGALMRKFKHENVVRMWGMIFERDTVMVVMELVTGGGLNDYVKKNKVSPDEKAGYAADIAYGLAYIHSLNCIHRDIACRNCLIDISKKIAKVSDFGLTRQTDKHKITSDERIPIRWIAPEVLKTYEYTRAADVYAYGILVWEIFANGAMPFGDKSNGEIKDGIQSESYRPIFPPDTPSDVQQYAAECWAGDPAARLEMKAVKEKFQKYKKGNNKDKVDTSMRDNKHAPPSSNPPDGGLPTTGGRAAKGVQKSNESKKTDRKKKKQSKDKAGKSSRK